MACNCTTNCKCGYTPIPIPTPEDGVDGEDGLGWTGGSYEETTGIVTFASTDGLGFSTQDLRGPEGPPGGGVTETTYSELVSLIDNDELIPGGWYKFPYQTIHTIGGTSGEYNNTTTTFDDGTAILSTFTPETENLMVQALDVNILHVVAKSCEYPRDIIHYNYGLDLTSDGLLDRPGFITYREDTDLQLSTFFDFRNVLHRRWDMDVSSSPAKDTDFQTMTTYHSGSSAQYNHQIAYEGSTGDMVPAFVNFDNGGNSIIGAMTTANAGTFRDFKTFVGLDFDLYASPVESARFKNIHIKDSSDVARLEGSGIGVPVTPGNVLTNAKYSFGNVVFFTRSAESIIIGKNASGITFTGKTIKNVEIGDNNENIIIGGSFAAPDYSTPGVPEVKNFNEYIKIGNSNRNISFGSHQRNIEVGHSNVSVTFNGTCGDLKLGSYNNQIYIHLSGHVSVSDFCSGVRVSSTDDLTIENSCQNIDVIICGTSTGINKYFGTQSYTANVYVDGFGNEVPTSIDPPALNNPGKFIGARCTNIYALGSSYFRLESQCININILTCAGVKLDTLVYNTAISQSRGITVGASTEGLEISSSSNVTIGKQCTGVKILNTGDVSITKIGDLSSSIMVYGGSGDVSIGGGCQNVFISGTTTRTTVGDYCVGVISRFSDNLYVGSYNTEIFLEGSQKCNIGNNNTNISLTDIGIIYKPGFPDFSTFHFFIDLDTSAKGITQTTSPGGSTLVTFIPSGGPIDVTNDWTPSMSSWVDAVAPGITISRPGSSNCNIGDNNSEIFIVGSDDCIVGNNCSDIAIGSNATSANVYTLGSNPTTGVMNSIDMPTVNATVVDEGNSCSGNILGNSCSDIKLRGVSQIGNIFADGVTSIEAVPANSFGLNRVLVNGNSVTLTSIYIGKVYDKVDSNGNRWEMTIDVTGALPANGTVLI